MPERFVPGLVALLCLCHAPAWAQPDGGGAAPDGGTAQAMADVVAGRYAGSPPLAELFPFALDDAAQVKARADALREQQKQLKKNVAALPRNLRGSAEADALAAALVRVEAELAVLELPAPTRAALVAEENARVAREEEERRRLEAAERLATEQRLAQEHAAAALAAESRVLDGLGAQLESVRTQQRQLQASSRERRLAAERRLGAPPASPVPPGVLTPAQADTAYDAVVQALAETREELMRQIDAHAAAPRVPDASDVQVPSTTLDELEGERVALVQARTQLMRDAREIEATIREASAAEMAANFAAERFLNSTRIKLLGRISESKRDEVLGLGPEGLAQCERELQHFWLLASWYQLAWRQEGLGLLTSAAPRPALGDLVFELTAIAFVVFGALQLRASRKVLLGTARRLAARLLRTQRWQPAAYALILGLDAILDEALLLVVVLLVGWLLGPRVGSGGGAIVYSLVVVVAAYRLVLRGSESLLTWLAETGDTEGAADLHEIRRAKISRSVTNVGRGLLACFLALTIAEGAVGRGNLFHVMVRLAWLVALGAAAWLLRQWRVEIGQAYLAVRPKGTLSDMVRETGSQSYGLLVSLMAFGVLAVSTAVRLVLDFLMGFDRPRKALAYFLRRRMEQEAGSAPPVSNESPLPDTVQRALTQLPLELGSPLAHERFPGLEEFHARCNRPELRGPRATLVVGRPGFGKTTWLNVAVGRCGGAMKVSRCSPPGRMASAREVSAALCAALGVDSAEELRKGAGSAQRLVVLDDLDLWFGRWPGGMAAWSELGRFIEAAEGVTWLGAIGHHTFEFIRWMSRGVIPFTHVVELPAWTESEIASLLALRMSAAGHMVRYQDAAAYLPIDGSELDTQMRSAATNYNHIIWDYSQGSPRAALNAWQESLAWNAGDHAVSVRLFPMPDGKRLQALRTHERFVLAGVAWHAHASIRELSMALRMPPAVVALGVSGLVNQGILAESGESYCIGVRWWPLVARFLKQNDLLGA